MRPLASGKIAIAVALSLAVLVSVLVVVPATSRTLLLRSQDVRFASHGATLAATLMTPRWVRPPYPAIVIVHGSGRVTRERLMSDAGALGARGAAVLVYDKRGVGESTGVYRPMAVHDSSERIDELADDAAAAVEYLASRVEIDRGRIGLMGGSEAGWVMPLGASRTEHAAFVIALSGPAVSSGEEALFSDLTGDGSRPTSPAAEAEIDGQLASFTGPRGFDPRPILEGHRVRTLWILGGRDRSIPPRQSERVLEGIRAGGNSAIDLRVFPTADHNLRDDVTGTPVAYWTLVTNWLRDQDVLR
jgi:dienelactone hydrolase